MLKVKKIMNKISMICLTLLIIISNLLFTTTNVHALSGISKVNANTVFDAEYGFSYRFISGVTTVETFGATNYKEDVWSTNDSVGDLNYWDFARVTSNNQKGKIGAWYKNVGTYQGQIIDLKVTVVDWDSFRTGNININGQPNYPCIRIAKSTIAVGPSTNGFENLKVRFEFFKHNTSTPITIKAHENLFDIDNGEYALLNNSAFTNGYLSSDTNLVSSGYRVECPEGILSASTDPQNWCTVFVNGSSFDMQYDRVQDSVDYTKKSRTFYQFGFNGESVAPFNTPYLTKSVSKNVITTNEAFIYTFTTNVPQQPSNKRYTSFNIADNLNNALQVVNGSFNVYNDAGQNVTDHFSLSQSGQTVTISAGNYVTSSSFYNKAYTFSFNVKPKDGYSFSPSNNKVIISNSATISTNYGNRTSNTVNTEVKFKITTQGTNASITASESNISGGSNRTVSWSAKDGYWLSSVIVDGVSQKITSYRGGSYTFSNINKDHDVKVVANPCYTITTEVINGTITGNQTKIDPGEDRTISFSPNEHYYVSEVIVDGHAYSYKDYASSYSFSDINENHHIKVVCEPLKTITTEIENGIITKTMTDVHPDDSKEVIYSAFEDYYIDKVIVDGQEVTVDDFRTGNYEFNPVVTDHYIKVICEPKPLITTEIVNGSITPEFRVFPNEDGYVHFRADDGYYVSRVLVDNQPYYNYEEYEDEYGFYNITADHHVYVECVPMPQLTLKKTTDKESYNYKDTIHYSVEVTQTVKNTSAYNVTITDADMPKNIEADFDSISVSGLEKENYSLEKGHDSWKVIIDELAYNQKAVVTFEAEIDDVESVGTDVTNTVYLTSDHFNSQLKDSVTNHILKPELNIEKTSDQAKYNTRDTVNYTIKVDQTTKNAKAFDVVIKDEGITKGVQIDLDSIIVSGTDDYSIEKADNSFEVKIAEMTDVQDIFISYQAKITDDTLAGKSISNTATVTSLTNTQTKKDTVENEIYQPQLVLSKTSDKDYYNVEDEAQFSITLTQSTENAIAHDVVLKDTDISNGVYIDFKSLQVNGIDQERYSIEKSGNGFEIHFSKMTNEVITITYNARINDNGLAGNDIQNSVEAYCANNPEKVTTSVEKPVLKPELTIEKISNSANYNVGDELEFTLKVNQTVENAIANHVVIKDFNLTEGIMLDLDTLSVDGISEDMYTITKDKEKNTFTVEINAVSYNQSITIKVKGTVTDNSLAGKEISNSASVTSSNNPDVVQDVVKADIYKPSLNINKTADKEVYNIKDIITYTLDIQQTVKNARANDVIVNDIIPTGLELDMNSFVVKGIAKNEYTIQETEKGFMIKISALEDKASVSYKAKIVDNDLAGKSVVNKADVTCSNNPDVIKTEVESKIAKPVLSLIKEVDKEKINVGDTLSYTLTLKQIDKDAIANDVILKDLIPEGLSLNKDSIIVSGIESDEYKLTVNKDNIELSVERLEYNVPIKVTFEVKAISHDLSGKDIENIATSTCSNNSENVKAQVISNVYKPVLSIEKTSDKDIYNVKDEIVYALNIIQETEDARANDVIINDVIPDGLDLDMNSFVVDGIEEDDYTIKKTDHGFIIKINALEDNVTITYKAKIIDNNLAGKSVINEANVTCSNNPDVIKTEVESKIAKPVLEIKKITDKEQHNVHDQIHYVIEAVQTNNTAIAYDIVIKDIDLTEGMKIDMDSITLNGLTNDQKFEIIKNENTFEIQIDYLNYDQKVVIEYNALINDKDLANQTVINKANITCSNNSNIIETEVKNKILMPVFEIEKTTDREYYNYNEVIHYTVKTRQTVEGAIAYDVVLDDTHLNDGLVIDMDSIEVKGIDQFEIDKSGNGYILIPDNPIRDEEITITYDALVADKELEGQRINHDVYIWCSNNPYVAKWESEVANTILKPKSEVIMENSVVEEVNIEKVESNVKTGDDIYIIIPALTLTLSALGIFVFRKKSF